VTQVLEGRLSREGRVVIPAGIRQRLGLVEGDQVQFVVDDAGDVHLTTKQALAEAVWAQNTREVVDTDDADQARESSTDADRVARWFDSAPEDMAPMAGDELLAQLVSRR
jgi:AbrB family looped-hinge helix DNA binding protein